MYFKFLLTSFLSIIALFASSFAKADFNYQVYYGAFNTIPNFSAMSPIASGTSATISLSVTSQTDTFGLVFTNQLTVSTAGTYEFQTSSDDGSRLYINNNLVVDNDGIHPTITKNGQIFLNPGNHLIRVEFFENDGGQSLDVRYRIIGGIFNNIPANGQLSGNIPQKNQYGEWGRVIQWPHVAISAANLPDGRVLTWSSTETDGFPSNSEFSHSAVFDPNNNTFITTDNNFHDMFCAGVSTLENGQIVASGGNPDDRRTSRFDPTTLSWAPLANMFDLRWYATNITLPNNEIFSTFGKSAGDRSEKYNPDANQWSRTPNASMLTLLNEHNQIGGMEWFAQIAVQPNGRVFHGGPSQSFLSFDPINGGANESFGQPAGQRARKWGNIATYDIGKVLVLGGADLRLTNRTSVDLVYLVDLNGPTPVVTTGAPMNYPRALSNTVTLPNGEVLVIGGNTNGDTFQDAGSILPAEIYNPSLNTWRVVASIDVPRNYHSTALLLKDGRVLSSGGGACGGGCAANHLDGQIYSPPYLFNENGSLATRPTLSQVPAISGAANSFTVTARADTQRFSMVRLSATTHHVNTDQRFLPVTALNNGNGTFTLTMQANPNVLIPGYYWLFAVNANGTPSIGQTIQIKRDFAIVDTDGDGIPDGQDPSPNGESQPPASAVNCANENATCSLPSGAKATVWFGIGNRWYSRSNVTNSIGCNNSIFGDPAIGLIKTCLFVDLMLDSDQDGVPDVEDAFPNDPTETKDTDNDGIGDNKDPTPNGNNPIVSLPEQPRHSTTLMIENSTGVDRIWNVNPDNNSVSVVAADGRLIREIGVGEKPSSLAKAPNANNVFVTNKSAATISVINTNTLQVISTVALPQASQPHGIVFNRSGSRYFVVLEANAQVEMHNTNQHTLLGRLQLSGHPRHLAMAFDDSRLLVSNFISPPVPGESTATIDINNANGQVFVVDPETLTLSNTVGLGFDTRLPSESRGPGLPNYLNAPVITFDNQYAYIPSKKDNIDSGSLRGKLGMTFDQTVRAQTTRIHLGSVTEETNKRIDFDNSSVATGGALTGDNHYLLVALETSRELAVYDTLKGFELMRLPTGLAPQSVALSSNGRIAYVHNLMDRSISRYDLTQMIQTALPATNLLPTVRVVTNEALSAQVLKGKQLFHDAADDRLARDNYMSCASCHNDGGHDGRVWDFTSLGEGLRNTTALNGRAGMMHGFLHWSANFDEIQDFEGQIRQFSGGTGLMRDQDFNVGTRSESLGDTKAGLSTDLDALAVYVSSLNQFAPSPMRNQNQLTNNAVLGKEVFKAKNCASCHGGTNFTDSSNEAGLKDIGTLKPSSGNRLYQLLNGLDTPTLRDVWDTAPYLHDGSAQTLSDAIKAHQTINLSVAEIDQLVAYISQIGNGEPNGADPSGNLAPIVTLQNPLNNANGNVSSSIEAIANDPDGTISKVEFYYDNNLVGTDSNAPYVFTWNNIPTGNYNLMAKAYDNAGAVTNSNIVIVMVGNTNNTAPEIILKQPIGNAAFASGSIEAVATDVDGSITKVEFYYGDRLLGTVTTAPYIFAWNNIPNGSYNLTAKAYDDRGAVSSSNVVTVFVGISNNTAPVIMLKPAIGSGGLVSGSIEAVASDVDGNLTNVAFYYNGQLLETVTTAPYIVRWNNVPNGTYTVTAVAQDGGGAKTTSNAIVVEVNSALE